MPIRLNLLAEAQAAEELRRRDPVKRALLLGAACVALMAVASLVIQSKVISTNSKANGYANRIQAITNDFATVMKDKDRLSELNLNIRGLDLLAAERFLNGNLLNAVQKTYVDHVQLIHLRTEHNYTLTEEARGRTNTAKVLKSATAVEKLTVVLEAMDTSPNPGDQVNKYKEALGKSSYFQNLLGTNNEMRLVNLSPPQIRSDLGQPVVQFTLESRVPERVRLEIASPTRYAPVTAAVKKSEAPKAKREEPAL
jgi:hypothetical protein